MVPRESIEGAELEPSGTELLVGIPTETADVRPDHLDPKDLEVEVVSNGSPQKLEICIVVPCPMKPELVRPQGWTPRNDERPFPFLFQKLIREISLEQPIERMHISLRDIPVMGRI